LQERTVRRVGGAAQLDVDVRIIAATNRSLPDMVAAGTFREDLFYRLNVFAIAIPPLRERRADLGPLVAALLADIARRMNIDPPSIPRGIVARIESHDWPGNVRELANVLESALVLGNGTTLVLPDTLARRPPTGVDFSSQIRRTIEDALRRTRGKLYGPGGAAELLGLNPTTLQSKMKKLGIVRPRP
jgi:transcriptional regulator with PAS, ATPase and Fis domain